MGCIEKLFFVGLTGLITYQAWYNFVGAMELGGKNMDVKSLAYSVGSLIPAIALGFHASKLAFAKTEEARQTLAAQTIFKVISYLYAAVLVAMVGFRVYIHF